MEIVIASISDFFSYLQEPPFTEEQMKFVNSGFGRIERDDDDEENDAYGFRRDIYVITGNPTNLPDPLSHAVLNLSRHGDSYSAAVRIIAGENTDFSELNSRMRRAYGKNWFYMGRGRHEGYVYPEDLSEGPQVSVTRIGIGYGIGIGCLGASERIIGDDLDRFTSEMTSLAKVSSNVVNALLPIGTGKTQRERVLRDAVVSLSF